MLTSAKIKQKVMQHAAKAQVMMNVITTLEYEHVQALGGTLASIAAAKAGIVKPGGTVVVAAQHVQGASVALQDALAQVAPSVCVHASQSAAKCGPVTWLGDARALLPPIVATRVVRTANAAAMHWLY